MMMPGVGTKVTLVLDYGYARFHRGTVTGAHENITSLGTSAFTVMLVEPNSIHGGAHYLWSFDPRFVEGVGWARGWEGPAVDALRVAEALT